ncbi:MAG: arylesterase [Novosphingobium sp.]|nr:arylesterase [Novosphingobium sp.]MBK9009256.1 arylesterase [Novosphingobium sp.]
MKWIAPCRLATPLALMAMLAACGSDQPATPVPDKAGAVAAPEPPPALPVVGEELRIVALGDSLFAGYGVDPGQSYPARIEAALRARGINARMTNAGVSGDTTSGGLGRVDFVLDSMAKPPQLVLISLGGNDMLRGLPPEETRKNLAAILGKLKDRKIPVVLMGMLAPPNLGADYAAKFNPVYPALAKEYGATLVPFFLQPVVGRPDLIQADRIHPTAEGIDLLVGATIDQVAGALPVSPAAPPAPR